MKNIVMALLSVVLLGVQSCKKDPPAPRPVTGDYLISGWTQGFTPMDAKTVYFRIASGELAKDTSQLYMTPPADISKFNFNVTMPADKYDKVKDLLSSVPGELTSMNGATIGEVMVDAGYSDVRARINNVEYKWRFEANVDKTTASIQQFVKRLRKDFY